MDANNIATNRSNTLSDWINSDGVLLVGRRGSTCIGLNDKKSDIDYLVVGDNSSEMQLQENVMLDTNLVTKDRFENMLQKMSIETIEALYNIEYVDKEFFTTVASYKNYVELGQETYFLFWYQIWLMLKNQLKQFDRGENNSKFASKIYLYGKLLEDENILDYWINNKEIAREVRATYFRIRGGEFTQKDLTFIENIRFKRNNAELRSQYRSRYNRLMSNFAGFN